MREMLAALSPRQRTIGLVLTLLLIGGHLLPSGRLFDSPGGYIPLHLVLELISITVSAMVVGLVWSLRRHRVTRLGAVAATGFLAVLIIDVFHTLSFQGMPELVTPSNPEKAINFWLAGRYVAALTMIAMALSRRARVPMPRLYLMMAAGASAALVVGWLGLAHPEWWPRTFVSGEGLTKFKVGAEYLVFLLYTLAATLLLRQATRQRSEDIAWLALAAWVQGLAELFFTLYVDVTDTFNLLGHFYKAIAYGMVYRALFVSGVMMPYARLHELEETYRQFFEVNTSVKLVVDPADGRILRANAAAAAFYGYPIEALQGMAIARIDCLSPAEFGQERSAAKRDHRLYENHRHRLASGEIRDVEVYSGPTTVNGRTLLFSIVHDVTDKRRQERELRDQKHRLDAIIAGTQAGTWEWNVQTGEARFNERWAEMVGYRLEELAPCSIKTWRRLAHPQDVKVSKATLERHVRGETPFYECVIRLRHKQDRWVWVQARGQVATWTADGKPEWMFGTQTDITEQKKRQARIEYRAHYDSLTGLPNRALLADRLHQHMSQAVRRDRQLAVALLDLDGFKAVNDSHGHDTGDSLLAAVAQNLIETVRETDTVARLGGDEFALVLADLTGPEECLPLLVRVLHAIGQPLHCGDSEVSVSGSLGVTFYPQAEDVDGDQLLRQADQAMYQAKLSGKNRFHLYDTEQDRSLRGHHESLDRVQRALALDELELHYQPKANLRSGEVVGVEALIRWRHPQLGLLLPDAFLPAIEEHPLAIRLGDWVLDRALTDLTVWQAAGLAIPVSVNVFARQLLEDGFSERLAALLAAHPGVSPEQLELEILESAALRDLPKVSAVMESCKNLGVRFALDDFGTGYSSLTYLKHLPADTLKIDQSFVRDMLEDHNDLAIVEGILGLANAFRRQVVAEGVETLQQGTLLLQLGCRFAQGYGIARPMPAADIGTWIATWRTEPAWARQDRVPYDCVPVLYAAAEHRAWIRQIELVVRGQETTLTTMDQDQCRFGAWLKEQTVTHQDDLTPFADLANLHRAIHARANQILADHAKGISGSEADMSTLRRLSEQLLERLERVIGDSKPPRDPATGSSTPRPGRSEGLE